MSKEGTKLGTNIAAELVQLATASKAGLIAGHNIANKDKILEGTIPRAGAILQVYAFDTKGVKTGQANFDLIYIKGSDLEPNHQQMIIEANKVIGSISLETLQEQHVFVAINISAAIAG